jgi:hypothetical protein
LAFYQSIWVKVFTKPQDIVFGFLIKISVYKKYFKIFFFFQKKIKKPFRKKAF